MEQNEIREYNNVRYTKEEGAAIIKELDDRTKHLDPDYNTIQLLAEKVKPMQVELAKKAADVPALKALTGMPLGSFVATSGFYPGTTLGGATYKKVDPTGLTANDIDVIEAGDGSYWQLAETERVTPYMFGCRAETASDTPRLQRFFDYCDETKAFGDFSGKWIVNATVEIKGEYDNAFLAGTINPVQTGLPVVIRILLKRGRIFGKLRTIGGSLTSDGGITGAANYSQRTSLNGVVFDNNGGRNYIDAIEASGFKKWGVKIIQQGADNQSSILDWIGNIKGWNCGSGAIASPTRALTFNVTSFVNNGGTNSASQYSTLTVDALDEGLEDGSIIKIGSRLHHILKGSINVGAKTFDVYPWVDELLTYPQIAKSLHGGACTIEGNNTANIKIDQIDAIGSGTVLKHAGLYGSKIGVLQSQFCSVALTVGIYRGDPNIGGTLGLLYTEGDEYTIVQATEQENLINIQSIVPALSADKTYIFQRQSTGGGSTTNANQGSANFSVQYNGVRFTGGVNKLSQNNMRGKGVVLSNAPDKNSVVVRHNDKSITLKWDEAVNSAYGYEDCSFKIIGTSTINPTGTITLNVDAADIAAGIKVMGGTSYVIPKSNVMLNYYVWYKYSTKDWQVVKLTPNAAESGTTANRPTSPVVGYPYYNTTLARMEWWNGATWVTSLGDKRVPKEITIGDWDMTSTFNVLVPHGLSATEWKTIRDVGVEIRNDDDTNYITANGEIITVKDSTNLDLQRVAADRFDSADFDTAASYNRGTVRFTYIPD